MCCAPSARVFPPADETAAGNVGQRGRLAVAQGHVEMLALAALASSEQRGHDAVARVQARGQIRDGDAHLDGRPVALAGDVHQSEFRLDHDVVAGPIRIRARLAVAGDGGIYQARIDLAHRFVVHGVFLQRPREIILNQNVTFGDQLVQDIHALFMLKGQTKRLFVSVCLHDGGEERLRVMNMSAHGRLTPMKYADSPGPVMLDSGL